MTDAINITADVASETSSTFIAHLKGKRTTARTGCRLAFAVFSFLLITAVSYDYAVASIA